jgi:quercetin dioxygenase-like cupin family protein
VVTRWAHAEPPRPEALETVFQRERLSPQRWSAAAGERFSSHQHPYHKVLFCLTGSITFRMTPTGEELELQPGDRLDLPEGWPHAAVAGPEGVTCVEAARPQR